MLVELLADALGLERVLADHQRREHLERAAHQRVGAEDAADADQARIGVHEHERVEDIVGADLARPAGARGGAPQSGDLDPVNPHGESIRDIVDNMLQAEPDPGLPTLAPASMRSRASDALRSAIVNGRLRPGDRLKEVELAERLGISRAPVREALRQLEHEGLVVSLPYRATEVLGVSQEEISEVLVPIRLTLETFAFRKALPQLTDADLQALGEQVDAMRRAGTSGDADALAEADVRFHELVLERSGQPHCLQLWRSIEPRVRAYFRRDAPAHASANADEVADEHAELLAALRNGEEGVLLETLGQHINNYLAPSSSPEDAAA